MNKDDEKKLKLLTLKLNKLELMKIVELIKNYKNLTSRIFNVDTDFINNLERKLQGETKPFVMLFYIYYNDKKGYDPKLGKASDFSKMIMGNGQTETLYLDINDVNIENITEFTKWASEEEISKLVDYTDKNTLTDKSDVEEGEQEYELKRICLLTDDLLRYHKYCGFNKFTIETFPVPKKEDGWTRYEDKLMESYENDKNEGETIEDYKNRKIIAFKKRVNRGIFDPEGIIFTKDKEMTFKEYSDWTCYDTLDNYDIGFKVFIQNLKVNPGKTKVVVYGRTHDLLPYSYMPTGVYMQCGDGDSNCDDSKIFTNLIYTVDALQIFIGESKFNKLTSGSGGYGKKWDGNSILLLVSEDNDGVNNKYKYVHIGIKIFEFTTDEKIIKYVSSVGGNCVPYPYAESQNWCYDMVHEPYGTNMSHVKFNENREEEGSLPVFWGNSAIDNKSCEKFQKGKCERFDTVVISKRDIENYRFEVPANEITHYVRDKVV